MFQKATKKAAKLRMSIAGPSGSGKTYTALLFAQALSPSGKIAVVDTEHGSASKYADQFDFDVVELSNFHPDKYVKAISAAVSGGYEVVILDSITHAWNGPGGILAIVNQNFGKWKDVQPVEQAFIEAIVGSPIHIIATMRAKVQYEVEKDTNGKPSPKKIGMGAIQRDGMEYEFDIAAMMDVQNTITVEKTRCSAIQGVVVNRPDASFMTPILRWLAAGPVHPEVQFMADGQPPAEDEQPAETRPGQITEAQLNTIHALGVALYGSSATWDAKRPGIVDATSSHRTKSSKELWQAEATSLITVLEKRVVAEAKRLAKPLVGSGQIATVDEIDQSYGVELAQSLTNLRKVIEQAQPVTA